MNVIKNSKECREARKKPSAVERIYKLYISMHFSLFLLAFLAAGSMLGTFMKQGASEEEYLALYTENTYRIIKFFGLNDVYHSAWFYALIGLFALNLALCTIRQLTRLVREKRRTDVPEADRLRAMECSALIPGERKEEAIKEIEKTYRLICEDKSGMVFERAPLSRWGVFITHGSIIVILVGALVGLMFGFRGFVVLGVGETKDRVTTEGANAHEEALGFAIRCRDFKASVYPNGAPKDYVSRIDVIESGKVIVEKNIRVNDPLYYKGLRIYQSGYGQKGSFTFRIGDEEVVLAEQETFEKGNLVFKVVRFENEVHDFGPGIQIVYLEGDEPKTTWFLQNVERLRSQTIQNVNIQLIDISENPYTSLEVTSDPGVFVVWTGFALILFGLYVTFFTYGRRIFIVNTENGTIMAGFALKNKEMFKKEFEKLKEGVLRNVR